MMDTEFNRDYYETYYRNYSRQNPGYKTRFYARLARMAAGKVHRPRILDIGCAFGGFLGSLNPGWDRCGVDASDYAIALARDQFPDVRFEPAGAGEYPIHGPFDVITAFDVLEHIPSVRDTFAWIESSLSPGGGFVFVVPVYDGPTGPVIRCLDKDPTHIHREARGFWLDLAGERMELLDWWGIYRYLLPAGIYVHFVTRRWRRFTPAIACVFRRKEA